MTPTFKKDPFMSKKLLLELPEDVHIALKQYQINRRTQDHVSTTLNELLIELVKAGTTSVNATATGILERAARKGE
jgi:hypothetical protein